MKIILLFVYSGYFFVCAGWFVGRGENDLYSPNNVVRVRVTSAYLRRCEFIENQSCSHGMVFFFFVRSIVDQEIANEMIGDYEERSLNCV